MGRGNVSVSGPYKGLYYIDNDDFHVYRRDDLFSGESETRLKGELSRADFAGSKWVYDELGTAEEERDILDWFMNSFTRMFPSFRHPADELWIRNGSWGVTAGRSSWRTSCITLPYKKQQQGKLTGP